MFERVTIQFGLRGAEPPLSCVRCHSPEKSSRTIFFHRVQVAVYSKRLLRCSSRSASARTHQIFMRDFCFTIRRQILISDTFQGSLLLRRALVSFSPQREEGKKDRAVSGQMSPLRCLEIKLQCPAIRRILRCFSSQNAVEQTCMAIRPPKN